MRNITVIHPSRGRAEMAARAYEEWRSKARQPFNYVLSIEPDQVHAYSAHFDIKHMRSGDNKTAVEAINNAAAKLPDFDILVVMSDDFHCPDGWDDLIREAVGNSTDFVLKTWDGIQRWIVTLPIMDRAFYQRYGYVYYPGYRHMFCDTELTCVAEYTGRLIKRLDLTFIHDVASTGNDATNARNNASWAQGEALFLERHRINFGIEKLHEISDAGYRAWIRSKTNHNTP